MNMEVIIEAILFAATAPVRVEEMLEVLRTTKPELSVDEAMVRAAIDALNEKYAEGGHAVRVYAWGEGFQLSTIPDMAPYVQAHSQERRVRKLTRSLLETLAIVAYRQPVSKPEIDFIRGVDAGYALGKLLEMGYIEVKGRSDQVGRPLLYGTTTYFLEQFGLSGLEDLPRPREIEELLADPAFSRERAQLLAFQQTEETQKQS